MVRTSLRIILPIIHIVIYIYKTSNSTCTYSYRSDIFIPLILNIINFSLWYYRKISLPSMCATFLKFFIPFSILRIFIISFSIIILRLRRIDIIIKRTIFCSLFYFRSKSTILYIFTPSHRSSIRVNNLIFRESHACITSKIKSRI